MLFLADNINITTRKVGFQGYEKDIWPIKICCKSKKFTFGKLSQPNLELRQKTRQTTKHNNVALVVKVTSC